MADERYLAGTESDAYTPDDLITGEKQIVTQPVVVVNGSGVVAQYTVMGVITATGKSKPAASANGDGSEVVDHILINGVDASAADAKVAAYKEGCFNPDLLTIGAGLAITDVAVINALRTRGIYLQTPA